LPKILGTSVFDSNSVAIKNGNNAGTTEVPHNVNPFFAADKLEVENITRHIVNNKKIIGRVYFFILITKM
jgi:hypothetical protein